MELMITSRTDNVLTHSKVYKKAKFSILREEYLAITGSYSQAIVLEQMITWARTTDKLQLLIEGKKYILTDEEGVDVTKDDLRWTFKSSREMAQDTLLTERQCKDALRELTSKGYLERRNNPRFKWDKTLQYKINYEVVINSILSMGFGIEALKLSVQSIDIEVPSIVHNVPSIGHDVLTIPSTTSSTTPSLKNICVSESQFLEKKEEYLIRAKELYPNKDAKMALEDFIAYIQSTKNKYKDFNKAFLNWVRTDKFGKYSDSPIVKGSMVPYDDLNNSRYTQD